MYYQQDYFLFARFRRGPECEGSAAQFLFIQSLQQNVSDVFLCVNVAFVLSFQIFSTARYHF